MIINGIRLVGCHPTDCLQEHLMTSPSAVPRRTVAKGVAWSAPAVALAVSAPALAASPTKGCYVFDMWSSNCRQPINNNRDEISGSVRYLSLIHI